MQYTAQHQARDHRLGPGERVPRGHGSQRAHSLRPLLYRKLERASGFSNHVHDSLPAKKRRVNQVVRARGLQHDYPTYLVMRVAFPSTHFLDPDNVDAWSGLPFIRQALETAGIEQVTIPLADPVDLGGQLPRFLYWRWLRGKRYLRHFEGRAFEKLCPAARTPACGASS